MSLVVRSAACTIMARVPYSDNPDNPMVWGKSSGEHQGRLIEKLVVMTDDGQVIDNLTLHPSVNGEAARGARVALTIEVVQESTAVRSAEGPSRDRVGLKNKLKVLAAEPAK